MPRNLSKPRARSFKLQSGRCFYCGAPIWLENPEAFAKRHGLSKGLVLLLKCTGEHLLPRSDGGDASQSNIVAACRYCNATRHKAKHPLDPTAYKRHVGKRLRQGKWHPPAVRRLLSAG
ncbi:HNH endonuclease [Imhoffiella purpurea]|uniref:HNH domain-containing protein n=1 Tax=Imhoffiella purpurea TaxID=1249627 RepID=W9VUT6_9GAMM|nr:HNH endonuclease [Imhoffiella purpurea]EXJ14150.1 hypothetical protein D779_2964 [Imhoffiella purpurea]